MASSNNSDENLKLVNLLILKSIEDSGIGSNSMSAKVKKIKQANSLSNF